jgi:hypothetical protein
MEKEIDQFNTELTNLRNDVSFNNGNLSVDLKNLNSCMEKIQDNKIIDNEFVKDMYKKLLEDYITYAKDGEDNLLLDDIKNLGEDEVKRKILS